MLFRLFLTCRSQIAMLDYVRRGDTVIVESISSFARSTRDLLDLTELLSTKGV